MGRIKLLVAGLSLLLGAMPAMAQPPDRPDRPDRSDRPQRSQRAQRLTIEQLEKAWKLQVEGFALSTELPDEEAKKVTQIYLETRQNLREAARDRVRQGGPAARPGRGGQGRGNPEDRGGQGARGGQGQGQGANAQLARAEREKFGEALSGILDDKQHKHAMATLGTFNPGWDRMVHTLAGFELDTKTMHAGLGHIETYVATISAIRRPGEREQNREAMQGARTKLTESLDELLDDTQMSAMRQAFGAAGQRGGPQDGQPPSGRGGEGGAGSMAERLRQFDLNEDGLLQKDELPERMLQFFDRLDTNGDGALDAEEMGRMRQGGRGGQGRGGGGG